ncbi:hypothetical protein J2S43_007852 [Catenuloplanes nepalensis]|uniref:Uncharacterized protein n=1 Tax=Catenuloplanes nepalensis TaxID=587533 RepID=A0ABT9N6L2_9ACTN|nr:hypothetical protein [Catenuloplanes nepalensis]MDP9799340.1 hypothetical protein [Catenuloplanes nepalensis]
MSWWAIVATPEGLHAFELGDVTAEEVSARLATIRAELAVPEDWYLDEARRWDVQVSPGDPHPSLLERATVHRIEAGETS